MTGLHPFTCSKCFPLLKLFNNKSVLHVTNEASPDLTKWLHFNFFLCLSNLIADGSRKEKIQCIMGICHSHQHQGVSFAIHAENVSVCEELWQKVQILWSCGPNSGFIIVSCMKSHGKSMNFSVPRDFIYFFKSALSAYNVVCKCPVWLNIC